MTLFWPPLWYSLGPYTLKNLKPACWAGAPRPSPSSLATLRSKSALDHPYALSGLRAFRKDWLSSSEKPCEPSPYVAALEA